MTTTTILSDAFIAASAQRATLVRELEAIDAQLRAEALKLLPAAGETTKETETPTTETKETVTPSVGVKATGKNGTLAPTEQARLAALELARKGFGEVWRGKDAENAWKHIGQQVRAKTATEQVAGWYVKAQTQIKTGARCQQFVCFAKEWKAMTKAA